MIKILCIRPQIGSKGIKKRNERVLYLSKNISGDVILPSCVKPSPSEKFPHTVCGFRYHYIRSFYKPHILKAIWDLLYIVSKSLWIYYIDNRKYDVIWCYGWSKTGVASVIIKLFTGAKLVLQIPGAPGRAYLYLKPHISFSLKYRAWSSRHLLQLLLKCSDGAWLLYPQQLEGYKLPKNLTVRIFPDFVPISSMKPSDEDGGYILLIGGPIFLKGADLLIKAFSHVCDEFPEHRLRIVGYTYNLNFFLKLRGGNERIELTGPVSHDKAMSLIAKCSVFVLPSRTEAMGRVLFEAMAFRKPIIASNADGIPHYIKHGINGLLFNSEDIEHLTNQLRWMLIDRAYAICLAKNAYRIVHKEYSERSFAANIEALFKSVTEI